MKSRHVTCAGAALLLAACAATPPVSPVSPAEDLRLLTQLFEQARAMEQHLAPDFACVSMRDGSTDRDPSQALVQELVARWAIPVFPGSHCSLAGGGDTVSAPGAGGEGKWLRVSNFACADDNHCSADVSYYVANLGAGGQSVTMERTSGGWRITPSGMTWIS